MSLTAASKCLFLSLQRLNEILEEDEESNTLAEHGLVSFFLHAQP